MITCATKPTATKTSANPAVAKVAIAGGTGYVGQELIRLLALHPTVELTAIGSKNHDGEFCADVLPGFNGIVDITCSELNIEQLAADSDVLFLALPHGIAAGSITESVLSKTKVIDLSGDFRLKDSEANQKWYEQTAVANTSIYGLCELNRQAIKDASFIANPGCYATAAILALAPLVKAGLILENSIIMDGKSGVSGAGRTASLKTNFNECNESMKAYQLPQHRHSPEIEQALSQFTNNEIISTFAAHLVPMNRGILMTAYATLKSASTHEQVLAAYNECYANEPFVRMMTSKAVMPETRWVKGSNYCDINFAVDERSNRIVVVSAIDNLIKGAAGQAVQNMNLLLGLDETTGLTQIPAFL